jgi:hypothetical protein
MMKVAFGALTLDRYKSTSPHFADISQWWERIDLTRLDLTDGIRCVLGQLFGSFVMGRMALGTLCGECTNPWHCDKCQKLSYEDCDKLGFFYVRPPDVTDDLFDSLFRNYFEIAQECWIGEIAERLKGNK